MKQILYNDYKEMRAEYKDVLRIRNYNNIWIDLLLEDFDNLIRTQRWDALTLLMKDIGVELVAERI